MCTLPQSLLLKRRGFVRCLRALATPITTRIQRDERREMKSNKAKRHRSIHKGEVVTDSIPRTAATSTSSLGFFLYFYCRCWNRSFDVNACETTLYWFIFRAPLVRWNRMRGHRTATAALNPSAASGIGV